MTRPQAFENLPKATVLEQIDQFTERFQVADDTAAVTGQLVKLMGDFKRLFAISCGIAEGF